MNSMLLYVRNLLGWTTAPDNNHRLKRERVNNDIFAEEELPYSKKYRPESQYSRNVMASEDLLNGHNSDDNDSSDEVQFVHQIKPRNVRYVPIQIEGRKPVTSTPNECTVRTVPLGLVNVNENGDENPTHTPSRKAGHSAHGSVISQTKSRPKILIQIDDGSDDDIDDDDDDIIYVKKVTEKPQKYRLITKREDNTLSLKRLDKRSSSPYKLDTSVQGRSQPDITSRTNYSKLISGGGITKAYRKTTTAKRVKHLQQSSLKNKIANMPYDSESILSKLYDIDQKVRYRDLISKYFQAEAPKTFHNPLYKWINGPKEDKVLDNKHFSKDSIVNGDESVQPSWTRLSSTELSEKETPSESSHLDSSLVKMNTLEESFKTQAWYDCNFVEDTNSKYKEKNDKMKKKLLEVTLESDTMSKVNKQTKVALLERKFKTMAVTIEGVVEEDSTLKLPDLTPEQEKRVKRAWGPGPSGEVMVEKFNLRISRKDLQTLSNLNWLNDEVINFYMNLLMQRSQDRPELPKVYATNTFFYPKLMQSGHAGLKRWTRKVDIFAHDLMAVPIHLGVHWCMSLVDFRARRITYLDSMGGTNSRALSALLQYLRDEHLDKKKCPFDDSGWVTETLTDIPQQMNGSDCGMFSCTFAEFSARNAPYKFTQAHMPYLRRKAAVEIMEGRLLL